MMRGDSKGFAETLKARKSDTRSPRAFEITCQDGKTNMNTGHTKLRIALLASVSAAALFAAGSAYAETVSTFVNGDDYTHDGSTPSGADLSKTPGLLATETRAYVLENGYGATVSSSTANAVNANGTAVSTEYQNEGAAYTNRLTGAPAGQLYVYAAGQPNQGQIVPNTATYSATTMTAISASSNDPNLSYSWTRATYANAATLNANTFTSTGLGSNYLLNSNGTLLTASQASGLGITGTMTASQAEAQALSKGVTLTSVGATTDLLNNALLPSSVYNYAASHQYQWHEHTVSSTSAAGTNTTTSYAGGVSYASTSSTNTQSTTIGAGGLYSFDQKTGNTTSLSAGLLTLTNGATPGASITLDATKDPVLTVTGGTPATTTTINDGVVVAGTSVNTPVVNSLVSNSVVSNIGTANVGSLNVANTLSASNGTISAEGNRIQDVGTPIASTDAANKAYVDKGVNKAYEGTAIALAISQPVFLPGQNFAFRVGYGGYESQNAVGFSAAGVIARDLFGYGSTVSLDGGVGFGTENSGVAGKAGVTIGFGGGYAPLK